MIVLDASALLAFLWVEPGAERVLAELASRAAMSSVNLAEVLSKVVDRGTPLDEILALTNQLNCDIVAFDDEMAVAAARLRTATRPLGLSLGDRACLALAAARNLPVLTADRSWAKLDLGVEVQLIR
jgi:ribonuclease VapC